MEKKQEVPPPRGAWKRLSEEDKADLAANLLPNLPFPWPLASVLYGDPPPPPAAAAPWGQDTRTRCSAAPTATQLHTWWLCYRHPDPVSSPIQAAISYDTRDHKFTTFGTDAEAMRRLLDDMEYPLPFTLDEAGRPCEPRLVFSAVDDVLVEPLLQHLRQNKHKLLPSPSSPPAKELNDLHHEKTAIEGEEEDTVVGRYQCWLLHKTDEFQKVVPRDLPSGFYEGMTEENDVDLINETWTYRSATSKDNIRDCVIHRPTRCIRQQPSSSTSTNESNQLAQESGPICCWSLVRTDFQIGMTYTMPSCRRLGLAQRVLWWVAADLLAQQQERVQQMSPVLLATLRKRDDGAPVFPLTPFCYIHPENKASQAMVASLGFECLAHSSWIIA